MVEENSKVLAAKYWTLENGATAGHVVGTPDVAFADDNATTGKTIAPMQAFFVELASAETGTDVTTTDPSQTDLSIKFTPDMMSTASQEETNTATLLATNPTITITATRGEIQSRATLRAADEASNGYVASEDAVVLLDSELDAPMVYTVTGSQAAQVNQVKQIGNVALGLYNERNEEVTLTLSGLNGFAEPIYLYDTQTRQSRLLEKDSYSLTLHGSSHGRYYLRSGEVTANGPVADQHISIYSVEAGKVVVAATQPLQSIRVFRINGTLEQELHLHATEQILYLPAGLYVVRATDGTMEHTEKVLVR